MFAFPRADDLQELLVFQPFDRLVDGAEIAAQNLALIEFPSIEAAHACYRSPAYQAAKALRDPVSAADVIIVQGYDAGGNEDR